MSTEPLRASLAALMVLATASCSSGEGSAEAEDKVFLVEGSDHLPSVTATDWVTYADHVLVVTIEDEEELPPFDDEVDSGEGLVGREVSMSVDDVLWSSAKAKHDPPERLDWSTAGWHFKGSPEDRTEMSGSDSSRLEIGHTYVVAVAWEDARCAEGDGRQPAEWRMLGSGAVIPFDHQVLGDGEFEGMPTDVESMRARQEDQGSLRADVLGGTDDDVVAALDAAQPDKREVFHEPAPCD